MPRFWKKEEKRSFDLTIWYLKHFLNSLSWTMIFNSTTVNHLYYQRIRDCQYKQTIHWCIIQTSTIVVYCFADILIPRLYRYTDYKTRTDIAEVQRLTGNIQSCNSGERNISNKNLISFEIVRKRRFRRSRNHR